MSLFDRKTIETCKYAELVKLAKEHDVYRRYAPKAELIEKLLAQNESVGETLSDESMPSFMNNDDIGSDETDEGIENSLPEGKSALVKSYSVKGNHAGLREGNISTPSPLSDQRRNINAPITSSNSKYVSAIRSRSGTPCAVRRSLAGPAKSTFSGPKAKESSSETQKLRVSISQTSTCRLTRQRTYEVDNVDAMKKQKKQHLKREGTFEIEPNSKADHVKRNGTIHDNGNVSSSFKVKECSPLPRKLRREGTFEVEDAKVQLEEVSNNSHSHQFRREGTFEVSKTLLRQDSLHEPKEGKPMPIANVVSKHSPRNVVKRSLQSSFHSKRISIATPSSVKPTEKLVSGKSVPRRYITSRSKPTELKSPGTSSFVSASKLRTPSVMNEIHKKKAEVSAKKVANATGEKLALKKKAPDFDAIHKRLFEKMESIVDSKQKVIDRANSMQKCQPIKRSPPQKKVVRKLLSPKIGKSKFSSPKPSPKPVSLNIASAFASRVVAIQKRLSVGSALAGVSKLRSPRLPVNATTKVTSGAAKSFGFPRGEQARKDAIKESVIGRKPIKRVSPISKAKQALHNVRLNKRFELQMKHRLAQQEGKK